MLLLFNQGDFNCPNPKQVWADTFANRAPGWKPHASPDYVWEAGNSWFFSTPVIDTYPADGKLYLLFQWGNFSDAYFRLRPAALQSACAQEVSFIGRITGTYGNSIFLRRNGDSYLRFWVNGWWATLNVDVVVAGIVVASRSVSIQDPAYNLPWQPIPTVLSNGQLFEMRSSVLAGKWVSSLTLLETGQSFKFSLDVPDWPGLPWIEAWSWPNQSMWLQSLRMSTGPKGFETRPGPGRSIRRMMRGLEDINPRKVS